MQIVFVYMFQLNFYTMFYTNIGYFNHLVNISVISLDYLLIINEQCQGQKILNGVAIDFYRVTHGKIYI